MSINMKFEMRKIMLFKEMRSICLSKLFRICFLAFILIYIFSSAELFAKQHTPNSNDTMIIGEYEWTTENLNVTTFRNGESIYEAKTEEEWTTALNEGIPAWSHYDNNHANSEKYGKIYNIHAINDPRSLAHGDWRIPANSEWNKLVEHLDIEAPKKMKASSSWNDEGIGTNSSGFNAMPGGTRYSNGKFYHKGDYAVFATSDQSYFFLTTSQLRGIERNGNLNGLSVRLVRKKASFGFNIVPEGIPNYGITFVDNEPTGRSSHLGSAITETIDGEILAFYNNSSGIIARGHTSRGWTEYKRSTDGGVTWEDPTVFPYSKKVWEENWNNVDGTFIDRKIIMSVVTASNGNIIAFAYERPLLYFISYDNGYTWSNPRILDDSEIGNEEVHRLFDNSVFVHDEIIYVLVNARPDQMTKPGPRVISLYVSEDNGETFTRRSGNLFREKADKNRGYVTGSVLDDGRIIVYAYQHSSDEHNAPYVISKDKGFTWSEVKYTFLEKKTRHMSLSEKIGEYYFMTSRSGNYGYDSDNLVIYKSTDGINWDSGIYLNRGDGVVFPGADSYSSNHVIGKYDLSIQNRLLIQSSISYSGQITNVKHWWLENISGTEIVE